MSGTTAIRIKDVAGETIATSSRWLAIETLMGDPGTDARKALPGRGHNHQRIVVTAASVT
jgi:hypothetical protein